MATKLYCAALYRLRKDGSRTSSSRSDSARRST
jgi:hypothetical protein